MQQINLKYNPETISFTTKDIFDIPICKMNHDLPIVEREEIAEKIVTSYNLHSELIEALKEGLDQLESWNQESEDTFTMKRIKETLNKAQS